MFEQLAQNFFFRLSWDLLLKWEFEKYIVNSLQCSKRPIFAQIVFHMQTNEDFEMTETSTYLPALHVSIGQYKVLSERYIKFQQ